MGSTSVPGLAPKPIVDIQVSVADLADEPRYVPQLEKAGLVLRSRDELHRYFRPPAGQPREVHVHVCAARSQCERDHLLFRDYLRADPAACRRYAEAKRANIRRWSDDGWAGRSLGRRTSPTQTQTTSFGRCRGSLSLR